MAELGIGMTLVLIHLHRMTEHNDRTLPTMLGAFVGAGVMVLAIAKYWASVP